MIKEDAWQAELKNATVKADMKKLPLKEKVEKVAEIKQLQQEIKTQCDKEQSRNDEVTTH